MEHRLAWTSLAVEDDFELEILLLLSPEDWGIPGLYHSWLNVLSRGRTKPGARGC